MGPTGRAVVVGGSIAGLLAARALADHVDEVVVLDRDRLPADPVTRAGVPQGRHVHGLLARGREAMEELLPGLTAELVAQGAASGDFQTGARLHVGERALAPGESGLLSLGVSRPLLEWQVRRRVAALPNVEIRDRTAVLDLVVSAGGPARVTGLAVTRLDGPGTVTTVDADLVVDASGRTSRTPEWLERLGFPAPAEDHVRVDVCYATRSFHREDGDADGLLALIAMTDPVTARGGLLVAQEGGRFVAGLSGYHGDRPPTGLGEFLDAADRLAGPLGATLRTLRPFDDGPAATHRFASNVRRRYERARALPAGLLVLGDALCSFDPVYGQGMTVAAAEAVALRRCLDDGTGPDLARRFHRRAARLVDTPWTLVAERDRLLPGSTEPVGVRARVLDAWVGALLEAATTDSVLARTFMRVQHLVAPPSTLVAPGTVVRVAAARRRRSERPVVGRHPSGQIVGG